MNLLALYGLKLGMKKQIAFVLATMAFIVMLPIGAVFALSNLPLLVADYALSPFSNSGTVFTGDGDPEILAGYDFGNCTYWAALQRKKTGDPIPYNWGNAITWNTNAILAGYQVDHTPTIGSIFQWPGAPGGLGHVAYVKAVDPKTGEWTISEMNAVGWNVVNDHTFPASEAKNYNFIHDKKGVTTNDPAKQPILNLTSKPLSVGGLSL